MTARIARLDSRRLIAVTGSDARPFLHNLLTQDVEGLEAGELRYGALLTPPGRLLWDVFSLGRGDGVVLDASAQHVEALMSRLAIYRLRAKVEIQPLETEVFAAWDGPTAGGRPDPRDPALGQRLYAAGTATAAETDYHRHRIGLGVPEPSIDAPPDTTYPIEANLDLLNGIDFQKGCFVGQETTSRMKRRGAIKNRMLAVFYEGAPPAFAAEVLLNGDRRAGEMRGGIEGQGIALLRLDRLEGDLTIDGRPVTVRFPSWMPRQAPTP